MKTKKQMQAEIDRLTKQNSELVEALIAAAKNSAPQQPSIQFVPQPYPVIQPHYRPPYWLEPVWTQPWWAPTTIYCGANVMMQSGTTIDISDAALGLTSTAIMIPPQD